MTTAAAGRRAAPLDTVAAIDAELARIYARSEALEVEGTALSARVVAAEGELAAATVAENAAQQDSLQLELERARVKLRSIAAGVQLLTRQAGELTGARKGKHLAEAEAAYTKAVHKAAAAADAWAERFAAFLENDFPLAEAAQAAYRAVERANESVRRAGGRDITHQTDADRAWKRFPGLGEITHILTNVRAAQLERHAASQAPESAGA